MNDMWDRLVDRTEGACTREDLELAFVELAGRAHREPPRALQLGVWGRLAEQAAQQGPRPHLGFAAERRPAQLQQRDCMRAEIFCKSRLRCSGRDLNPSLRLERPK